MSTGYVSGWDSFSSLSIDGDAWANEDREGCEIPVPIRGGFAPADPPFEAWSRPFKVRILASRNRFDDMRSWTGCVSLVAMPQRMA